MQNELEQIAVVPKLTEKEQRALLRAEEWLLIKNDVLYKKFLQHIKVISQKVDDVSRETISKYLAMLIIKNEKRLLEKNRTAQTIAWHTGLKNLLIKHFLSPTLRESVTQLRMLDSDAAVEDIELIRNLYRTVIKENKYTLWEKMQAAKALEASHWKPRAKPAQFFNIEGSVKGDIAGGDMSKVAQFNTSGEVPSFNDPSMRHKIEEGRKRLQQGCEETIDQDGNPTDI